MTDFDPSAGRANPPAPRFADCDVIYHYSRAQALADGVLVDVTPRAREAGFVYPVALTSGLWADIQDIPEQCRGQDTEGRLGDVLWMARSAIKQNPAGSEMLYQLTLPVGNRTAYTVRMLCGPGDHREPVITLLRENED